MLHTTPHPLSGQTVTVHPVSEHQLLVDGASFIVEDWYDRVNGMSWMHSDGNMACLNYAIRSAGLPIDDEVVYGKVGGLGYVVHQSELG